MKKNVTSSATSRKGRKESINASINDASINNLVGVATSHDRRILLESGAKVNDIDFVDSLLNSPVSSEKIEDSKLYKRIMLAFSAPRFDVDNRKAELITLAVSRGASLNSSLIAAIDDKVSEEKRIFNANNPAPEFSVSIVLDWIRNNAATEFHTYTGVSVDGLRSQDITYYTRVFGVLSSSALSDAATLSEIVRAILSQKTKRECEEVAARKEYRDTLNVRLGCKRAALAAYRSYSYDKDSFLALCAKYWERAESEGSRLSSSIAAAENKVSTLLAELHNLTEGLPAFTKTDGILAGVWYFPFELPKRGISARVRQLWGDIRKRNKDIAVARELLTNGDY